MNTDNYPCPTCGKQEVCGDCKSDIAEAVKWKVEGCQFRPTQWDLFLCDLAKRDDARPKDWWDR